MKKFFKKIAISSFVATSVLSSALLVNAAEINEKSDAMPDGTVVIGVTKFEAEEIVTSGKTITATGNYHRLYDDNETDPVIYYYLGAWYKLDEENNATTLTEDEAFEEIAIYYVNNEEKMVEVPLEVNLPEGYELVFEANDPNVRNISYNEGVLTVPATLKEFTVFAENEETGSGYTVEEFARTNDEFEGVVKSVSSLESLKEALNNKEEAIRLQGDITGLTETLPITYNVYIDGNGYKIEASGVPIFHVVGNSEDEVPSAVLTVDNINLYNDTEAAIQVGSKGLLTDKETRLIADIGTNAYIECDEVGVLVYSKNSEVHLWGEIVINEDGAGIQGNGTNTATQNYGDTYVFVHDGAKITANNNGLGLYIPQDGEVNIIGGVIEASTPVLTKSGKLNVTGGTLKATGEYVTPIKNNNGGNPTGDVIFVELNNGYEGGKENDNIQITITGGELASENGNILRVTKTTETDATYIVNASDLVSATLGNSVVYNYETIEAKVATVDELKDALLNKNVTKVELTQDIVDLPETLAVNHDVEFNGNGHIITASGINIFHVTGDANDEVPTATLTLNNVGLYTDTWAGVQVGSKGLLTDKETKLKAVINEDVYIDADEVGVLVYSKNSTVDFYGEIVINGVGAGIQGNGVNDENTNYGDTIINVYEGSKITANNKGLGLYIPQDGEVNIYGGTIEASTPVLTKAGKLNVTGGTLTATGEYITPIKNDNGGDATGDVIFVELNNGYEGAKENDNIQITITGGELTSTNGNILRVTKTTETDATYIVNASGLVSAKVDNSVIYDYEEITAYADNENSLKDALLEENVAEIELTQDIDALTETLAVNHDVVFNGNGYSITIADDKNIFHVTGDLNDEVPTAILTLNNVKLYTDTWAGVQVGSKGLLTDKETKLKAIINKDVYIESNEVGVLVYSKNSTVDFYGEIAINKVGAGIQGNGVNDENTNYGDTIVNVYEGSKITANNKGLGLYIPQDGEVNIYGGTIEASTPVLMKAGKLNVTGGTLKATGEYITPIKNDNGGDATGDVIFVELNNGYEGAKENDNIQITITGGELTSTNGNILRVTKTTETDATYIVNADAYEKVVEDNSELYNLK